MENSMGFDEGRSPCEEEAGRCRIKVALYLPLGKKRSPWRGIGGAEHRLCSIFSGMDEEAYDVKIVIRGYNPEEEMRGYLEKYVSHWSMVEYVSSHYALMRYLVKEHFDVVCYDDCMMLTKDGILAACLARSKRLLMLVTVPYANWSFKKRWHALPMLLNVLPSNWLDTLYPNTKAILERRFPKKPVSVTPCSLPMMSGYLARSEKQNMILFSGRLVPEKNPILFAEAVIRIRYSLRECGYRALICGVGEQSEAIERMIEETQCSDVLQLGGYKRMEEVTPRAKVFCSLQTKENYPSQSLLEAIASGCYCIATNVGSTDAIVKPRFGHLIGLDSQELSEALLACIRFQASQWEDIEASAREFASENFSLEKASFHYQSIIDKLVMS